MSIYRATLSDGRVVTVEADQPPTEEAILAQIGADSGMPDFGDVQGGGSRAEPSQRGAAYLHQAQVVPEIAKGAGKELASFAVGASQLAPDAPIRALISRATGWEDPTAKLASSLQQDLKPEVGPQATGAELAKVAEFVAPGMAASKVAGGSNLLYRMLAQALTGGATGAAQSGGKPGETLGGALGGAAGEGMGAAVFEKLPALLRASGVKNWLSILRKSGMTTKQEQAAKAALEGVEGSLPVGTMAGLKEKVGGATSEAAAALDEAFKPVEAQSAQGILDTAQQGLEGRIAKRTIQPRVTFSDLTPQEQQAMVVARLRAGQPLPNPDEVLSAAKFQNPPLVEALQSRVEDVSGFANPTVAQARKLRASMGEQATEAYRGSELPKAKSFETAQAEVSKAMHDALPDNIAAADEAFHNWKTINTQIKKAFAKAEQGDPAQRFWQFYGARAAMQWGVGGGLLGGIAGGPSGAATGATIASLGAAGITILSRSAFWNSMSAATKTRLASAMAQMNEAAVTDILRGQIARFTSSEGRAMDRKIERARARERQTLAPSVVE